jgi:anaerobic selenocysteine-containing dehydrogenase
MSILNVSRRTVLKGAGIASVTAALGVSPILAKDAEAASPVGLPKGMKRAAEGWHYSHCRMCMRGTCANMYRVKDGIVVEVKGNENSPANKGALCPRGNSIMQNLYNPYRVKAPMKRTNPKKGLNEDPRWVEITWEEALSTTAKKLKAVRENDPRGFVYTVGFGDMDFFCTFLFYFAESYGTPNYLKTNGTLCTYHYGADLVQGVFPITLPDATYAKYIVDIGSSGMLGAAQTDGGVRGVLNRLLDDKDMRWIQINPYCGAAGSKFEWVPIKPGGELALLLGIAHSILFEVNRYDFDFVKWKTNGSYLIGSDGYYARGKDGKPQLYDLADKKVKSFDDKTLKNPSLSAKKIDVNGVKADSAMVLIKDGLKKYTPEWAAKESGIPAVKIREIARDFIDNASIGETVQLMDDNGKMVTFPKRTSIITTGRGVKNQRDGVSSCLVGRLIGMLVGSLDVPGGTLGSNRGPFLSPDADGVVEPKGEARWTEPVFPPQHVNLAEYFPHRHTIPVQAFKVIADPRKYGLEYDIEAMLTVGGNAITNTSEPYAMADSVAKIPFNVNVSYHYDEMAHMSDILLASHAVLERESVNCFEGPFDAYTKETITKKIMMYREPVPPLYNTRQPQDIIIELCGRMGMIADFNAAVNMMGVILGEVTFVQLEGDERLKPDKRYTIAELWDKGMRQYFKRPLSDMKKEGILIRELSPASAYNSYFFKKGETRHPIYFERLKASGDKLRKFYSGNIDKIRIPDFDLAKEMDNMLQYYESVIQWRPKKVTQSNKEYPLHAINWKLPTCVMKAAGQDTMPYLIEVGETFDPSYGKILLNTKTAEEYGIDEGNSIWVETENGKTSGTVHVTELIFPGVVGFAGALGRLVGTLGPKPASRPMFNKLTSGKIQDSCAVAIGVSNVVLCKIYKA